MMRNVLVGLAVSAAALIAGIVAGPLLFAVWQGLSASSDELTHSRDARQLLTTYRDRLPSSMLLLSIALPPDGEECGYSRNALFDENDDYLSSLKAAWTPYKGYDALTGWRNLRGAEQYLDEMAEYLAQRTTPFAAVFLRQCMSGSVFAGWCEAHVTKLVRGDGSTIGPPPERVSHSELREKMICTYLDGLAARNGKPLAKR